MSEEAMYAYDFEGRRYDVGDKLGFLEATVEYALRRPDLRDGFIDYLRELSATENIFTEANGKEKKDKEEELVTEA